MYVAGFFEVGEVILCHDPNSSDSDLWSDSAVELVNESPSFPNLVLQPHGLNASLFSDDAKSKRRLLVNCEFEEDPDIQLFASNYVWLAEERERRCQWKICSCDWTALI